MIFMVHTGETMLLYALAVMRRFQHIAFPVLNHSLLKVLFLHGNSLLLAESQPGYTVTMENILLPPRTSPVNPLSAVPLLLD